MTDEEFYNHFRMMKKQSTVIRELRQIKNDLSAERSSTRKDRIRACSLVFLGKIPKKYFLQPIDMKSGVEYLFTIVGQKKYQVFFNFETIKIHPIYGDQKHVVRHKLKDISNFDFEQMIQKLVNLESASKVINS